MNTTCSECEAEWELKDGWCQKENNSNINKSTAKKKITLSGRIEFRGYDSINARKEVWIPLCSKYKGGWSYTKGKWQKYDASSFPESWVSLEERWLNLKKTKMIQYNRLNLTAWETKAI